MNPCLIPPSRLARLTVLRTQSDERLVFLVRHGSEPAFEAIVKRYRRALVKHCARVVGSADAEEAVQDALVNAHAALAGGAEVRSLGPWLHTVARNAALASLRRRAARPECPHEGFDTRSVVDAPHAIRAELQDLVSALQSLPPRQRDAIVMRELEGRSYSEIAVRLGASDGAVRQLLNRARIAVRNSLGAVLPAGPLARWLVAVGDGGSTVTAKLSGAAVLSAVSAIAFLPPTHGPAKPQVATATRVRPHRLEVARTPRRAAVNVTPATLRLTRVRGRPAAQAGRVRAIHEHPTDRSTGSAKKRRYAPQTPSSSTVAGYNSAGQPSSGGWSTASLAPPTGNTPTSGSPSTGWTSGPSDRQQSMYEAPLQPAPTSPTSGPMPNTSP